jgi:uncharacterized protein YodC (DUF2158 family)
MLSFRVGDSARLKSGGPTMTVDRFRGDLVTCIGMDADEVFHREDIPTFMLAKIDKAEDLIQAAAQVSQASGW